MLLVGKEDFARAQPVIEQVEAMQRTRAGSHPLLTRIVALTLHHWGEALKWIAGRERQSAPDADLTQQAEVVGDGPVLGDLAVLEAADGDAGERDGAVLVGPVQRPA